MKNISVICNIKIDYGTNNRKLLSIRRLRHLSSDKINPHALKWQKD